MSDEELIAQLRAENETLRRDVKTAVMGDSAELADVKRENEKLRKALNGWQEWWALPWQDKRPDIAELIYRRAAAAIRESGE